jgi:hypothetical protein
VDDGERRNAGALGVGVRGDGRRETGVAQVARSMAWVVQVAWPGLRARLQRG